MSNIPSFHQWAEANHPEVFDEDWKDSLKRTALIGAGGMAAMAGAAGGKALYKHNHPPVAPSAHHAAEYPGENDSKFGSPIKDSSTTSDDADSFLGSDSDMMRQNYINQSKGISKMRKMRRMRRQKAT